MNVDVNSRIRAYREFKGLTQQELGNRMSVTRQTVAAWEKGESTPTVAQVFRLAGELEVPADLIFGLASSELPLLFRADEPSVLVPELKAILARRADDYSAVERALGLVPALPETRPMDGYESDIVEEVAHDVRTWLGVEEGPLHDGISLLEDKGLKVMLYPLPDEVSGFSAYTDESGGVIFINEGHPMERQIFTAFHEVAHLICHRQDYRRPSLKGKRDDPREKIANHFAGAVLLPKEALMRELRSYRGRWLPEAPLRDIKIRYQVSMRTIVIRAAQIGIISKKQEGQQIGVLDKKYGRHNEPAQLERSQARPRLERLVFSALVEEVITASRGAEIMGRPLLDVREELAQWTETPR